MVNTTSQKMKNSKFSIIQGGICDLGKPQDCYKNTEIYTEDRARIFICELEPNQSSESFCHVHSAKQITVLCGYAELILPKNCIRLFEGQLFKVPNGIEHKIVNYGKIPLKYVEIRTGPYVFDDDTIR